MTNYVNMGHGMATVIFTDGDGFVLRRGEKRTDTRVVKWIDDGIKIAKPKPAPVAKSKEVKDPINQSKE